VKKIVYFLISFRRHRAVTVWVKVNGLVKWLYIQPPHKWSCIKTNSKPPSFH